MWKRRSRLMLAITMLAAGSSAGFADDAHKPANLPPDDELLEFLGGIDTVSDASGPDDGSWIEYLTQTDIGKVTKPGKPMVVAAKPPTPAPKPGTPGAKQDD